MFKGVVGVVGKDLDMHVASTSSSLASRMPDRADEACMPETVLEELPQGHDGRGCQGASQSCSLHLSTWLQVSLFRLLQDIG